MMITGSYAGIGALVRYHQKLKRVVIDEPYENTPAAQAGLHKDDVIIGVNRDRVNSIAEMRKVLEAKPSIIALQVVRGNESIYLLLR